MIASLPMYARPELDYAISLLWDLIRKNLSKKGNAFFAHIFSD